MSQDKKSDGKILFDVLVSFVKWATDFTQAIIETKNAIQDTKEKYHDLVDEEKSKKDG